MKTERLAILPLTGAGETKCDKCRYYSLESHWGDTYCDMLREDFPETPGLRMNPNDDRLPACIQAERDAARLRKVEVAAWRLLNARANASACIEIDAWAALRAALKECQDA